MENKYVDVPVTDNIVGESDISIAKEETAPDIPEGSIIDEAFLFQLW